jgi:hypothetical protein
MGRWLHYDHDEHGGYLGFSHARCNQLAGASKGGKVTAARRATTTAPGWRSRQW